MTLAATEVLTARTRALAAPARADAHLALGDTLRDLALASNGPGSLLALEDAAQAYLAGLAIASAHDKAALRQRLRGLDNLLADHGGFDDLRIEIALALRRSRPTGSGWLSRLLRQA